ncbi:DM13 domain-containing protein [Eionea flava]
MMKLSNYFVVLVFALVTSLFSVASFAQTVSSGVLQPAFSSWGKKSVVGSWQIVEEEGQHFIVLGDDFSAKEGPDVKVFLSPKPANEIEGSNATDGSLYVTQITRFKGQYRIAIPKTATLDEYQSLVFHCEEFSKLWGTSALR